MSNDNFAFAEKIADAVLYEGYLLYPYRKSALKNQFRWQFGVVAPAPVNGSAASEPHYARSECPVEPGADAVLTVRIRFLQLQLRTVEELVDAAGDEWRACERMDVDGVELLSFEEGIAREIEQADIHLLKCASELSFDFVVSGGRDVDIVRNAVGATVARVVRERQAVAFALRVQAQLHGAFLKLTVHIENTGAPAPNDGRDRDAVLRRSLIGAHALIGLSDGEFVSVIDPPPAATAVVNACENRNWWPVLAGADGARDVMLCAPIILYDYPKVAPQSAGDFFDGLEIDELLTLRMMTLTAAEKSEVTATDARARQILERSEQTPLRTIDELHAVGSLSPTWEAFVNPPDGPSPESAWVMVGDKRIERGSRVRLEPRGRADAMDIFLAGRIATVAQVHTDLEERTHVAVTLDDDPGRDLRDSVGRFFYFAPDDLIPLEAAG